MHTAEDQEIVTVSFSGIWCGGIFPIS